MCVVLSLPEQWLRSLEIWIHTVGVNSDWSVCSLFLFLFRCVDQCPAKKRISLVSLLIIQKWEHRRESPSSMIGGKQLCYHHHPSVSSQERNTSWIVEQKEWNFRTWSFLGVRPGSLFQFPLITTNPSPSKSFSPGRSLFLSFFNTWHSP